METDKREDPPPCEENMMDDRGAFGNNDDDGAFLNPLACLSPPEGAARKSAANLPNDLSEMQPPPKKPKTNVVSPNSKRATVPTSNFENNNVTDDSSSSARNPDIPPEIQLYDILGGDNDDLLGEDFAANFSFELSDHSVVLFSEGAAPNHATELWNAIKQTRYEEKGLEPLEEDELDGLKEELHSQLKRSFWRNPSLPEPEFLTAVVKDEPCRPTDRLAFAGDTMYRRARVSQGEDEVSADLLAQSFDTIPDHYVLLRNSTRNPTKALDLLRGKVRPERQRGERKRKPLADGERDDLTNRLHELLKKEIPNCQRPVFIFEPKSNGPRQRPLYRPATDSEFESSLVARISRPFRLPLNDETVRLAEFLGQDDNFDTPVKKEEARQFRDFVRLVRFQVPCIGAVYRSIYEASCIQAINNAYSALMKKECNRKRKKSPPSPQGNGDRDSDLEDCGGDSNHSGSARKPRDNGDSRSSGNPDAFDNGFTPTDGSGNGTKRRANSPCDEYDYSSLSSYDSDSDDSSCLSGYEAANSEDSDFDSDECEDDLDEEDTLYESEEKRKTTQMKANHLIMRYLQDPSLDLAEPDESGMTVLHKMCSLGHLYYVGWLLYKGVDPLLKTKDDRTALDIARFIGRSQVVQLLEEAIGFRKDHPDEAPRQVAHPNQHFQSGVSPERPHEYEEMRPSRSTTGDFSMIEIPSLQRSLELAATPEAGSLVVERPHVIEDASLSEHEDHDESDSLTSDNSLGLKDTESSILTLTDPNNGQQQPLSSSEDNELEPVPLVTAQLADSLSYDGLPAQEAIASLVEQRSENTLCQYNGQAVAAGCMDSADPHEKSQLVTALERVVSTVVEGMASLQKQQKEWLESQENFLSRLSRGNSSKTLHLDLPDVRSGPLPVGSNDHRLVNSNKPDPPGMMMEESCEVQNCSLVRDESWDEVSAPDTDDTLYFAETKDVQDLEEDERDRCLKQDDSWETDSAAGTIFFVKEQYIEDQGPDNIQETTPPSCLCHAFVLDACGGQCDNSATESCCFLNQTSVTSFDGKVPALVVLDETTLESSASASSSTSSSSSLSSSQPRASKTLRTMLKRTARRLLLKMNSTATQ